MLLVSSSAFNLRLLQINFRKIPYMDEMQTICVFVRSAQINVDRKAETCIKKLICIFTEARAEISGPSEKYLKPGSVLRLTCRVVENIENPLYIFWYQNNHMINYDSHRGVNVSTETGKEWLRKLQIANKQTSFNMTDNRYSELTISQTTISHSGNYSCVTNNAVSSSTLVHIFNGKLQF